MVMTVTMMVKMMIMQKSCREMTGIKANSQGNKKIGKEEKGIKKRRWNSSAS